MMKTMKKGLVRTVAFVVAWTLCWTTISNSLFMSVSYAAEAEEENQNLPLEGEVPAEQAEEVSAAEEAAPVEEIIEEIPAEEAEPQNLPLEGAQDPGDPGSAPTGAERRQVAAQPTEEVSSEQTLDQVPAQPTDEQTPAEPTVTEESISLTITYKTSEGGSVSVEKEVIEYKKITTTDAEGNATVTTDPETITVKGAKATADEGYEFTAWKSGDKVVSEKATFVPALPRKDVTFTAVFTEKKVEEESSEEETTPHQSATPTASPQGEAQEQESKTQNLPLEGKVPAKQADEVSSEDTLDEETVKQADEVEDDIEEEDKVSYPAASFTGETGDVSVRAHVEEGVFPEGTTMNVSAVSASEAIAAAQDMVGEGTEVVDAVAADITFRHEGEEIQPEGGVYVRLSTKRAIAGESHEAITIDGSGSASSMGGASAHSASFDTDHFTVYGVVGTEYADEDVEQSVRHKYEFYAGDPAADQNTWTKVYEQIVINGDTLLLPEDPAGDAKHEFTGWYLAKVDENGAVTYGTQVTSGAVTIDSDTIEGDGVNKDDPEDVQETFTVYAKFDNQYKITLYTDESKSTVFQTILLEDGDSYTLPIHDEAVKEGLIVAENKKLDGWVPVEDTTKTPVTGTVTINGADLEYYAHFADAYTVHFETVIEFDDFSVPNQRVFVGDYAEEPDLTTLGFQYKDGYKLLGWFTGHGDIDDPDDSAWGEKFDFKNTKINGNTNLYAKWEVNEVKITIELYLEAQNSKDYEFIVRYDDEITGKAGQELPWDQILRTYQQSRTFATNDWSEGTLGKKLAVGHWAGTGYGEADPTEEEGYLSDNTQPAIVVMDEEGDTLTASLSKGSTTPTPISGNAGYKVKPDGSTTVRIYYARDTYNLHFVFSNNKELNGASDTMPDAWKQYAPEGYENVTLPTYLVKNGMHLGKRTYNYPDSEPEMFDAFLQSQVVGKDGKLYGWEFDRVEAGGNYSGTQTVFDASNMTYDIRPDVTDGEDIYIRLFYVTGKTAYPYEVRYYSKYFSQEEIINGDAAAYEITELRTTDEIAYTSKTHSHSWHVNYNYGGYRLAAVTNYGTADPAPVGDVLSDGGHKFTWKKNAEGQNEKIILHHVPAEYKIIFRQTANGKTPGGWNVKDPMSAITVGTFAVGTPLNFNELMANAWFDSEGLKKITDKERGVEYTATGNWVLMERNTNTNVPVIQTGVTMENGVFPTVMPAQDLIFYMEWVGGTYQVTTDWNCYDLPDGVTKVQDYQSVNWNETVTQPAAIQRLGQGWTLIGWEAYERNTDGTAGNLITDSFNFTTPVRQDYYLKAKWENEKIYTVLYKQGEHGTLSGGAEVRDPASGRYTANANAPVKYTPAPEEGYVFIGWAVQGAGDELLKKESGALFGSYDSISYSPEYDKDGDGRIVLIAQYARKGEATTVRYHANYPTESGVAEPNPEEVSPWTINKEFQVRDIMFATPAGYRFVCWVTKEGERIFSGVNKGSYFYPTEWAAAGDADNDLYAVWEVVTTPPTPEEPEPEDPTDIPDEPTPTADTPDDPAPETVTPAPEPVNPVVTFIENVLGVRRVPEEAAAADDDTPAVAGSRRSRVDTNDYSRMEYWMILALGCILIQADMFRKVKKQKATK